MLDTCHSFLLLRPRHPCYFFNKSLFLGRSRIVLDAKLLANIEKQICVRNIFLRINSTGITISGKPNANHNPYIPYINGDGIWQESRIEQLISEWLNDASISIKTKFENHEPKIFLASGSVLDTAKYQLALLLLCNEGISPRRCACCNSYFIPSRENQKYCSFCSPQKRYAQRKRALAKKDRR